MPQKSSEAVQEGVPAWKAIDRLGYKASLYLASADKQRGVVLLQSPSMTGVAWWTGNDWKDLDKLQAQIKWSPSALSLLAWALEHPTVSAFDPLLHLLTLEVHRTAN